MSEPVRPDVGTAVIMDGRGGDVYSRVTRRHDDWTREVT
jgi:hypothetical protein